MGFNTTVIVLNDALHEIENDPDFGKKLADAVKQLSLPHRDHGIDVTAGCHCNAATVVAVYMIVLPDDKGIVYDSAAKTAQEAWRKVIESEAMGTGVTKEELHKKGYRAKKVVVSTA